MLSEPSENILLVGACGHCAKRNYIPAVERCRDEGLHLRLPVVVDLVSRSEDIAAQFCDVALQPRETILVPDNERDRETVSEAIVRQLDFAVAKFRITTVVIVTEPRSHMAFLRWAIPRSLRILVEKPLSAPVDASNDMVAAKQILANYREIHELLQRFPRAHVTVMTQRRYHSGYEFVREYVAQFVREFEIPISFFDAYYSDGQWTLPDEYSWDDHPFDYGYGKLHHGGYHFIDLMAEFVAINDTLSNKASDRVDVYSRSRRPPANLLAIGAKDYERLFQNGHTVPSRISGDRPMELLGETDVFSMFGFCRGRDAVMYAQVDLLHSGVSRRAWRQPASDTYKQNGRIRHERLRIDVGPLLAVEVRSYEAHETAKLDQSFAGSEVGGPRHFDVTIFRNSGVVGGEPVICRRFGHEHCPSLGAVTWVDEGRRRLIRDFFSGRATRSDFASHLQTNYLLSLVAQNLAKESQGQIPQTIGSWPMILEPFEGHST